MEPNMKLILDEISQLNRRFDEQDGRLNRRFAELELSISDRSTAIDSRLTSLEAAHVTAESALSRPVADLESAPADLQVNTVESRVTSLEASYTDRDAEFNNRLRTLEALRISPVKDERDDRVTTLEKATKELCAWQPEVDGVLDDIRISVQKMAKNHARAVFDEMPHGTSIANSPTKAAANSSKGFPAELPVFGRRVEPTTQDTGPGEEVASPPSKPFRSGDWSSPFKSLPAVKTPLPLPPPPKVEKAHVTVVPAAGATSSTDSTLKAVKAYRRALGLCFKCGGKWSMDHQCSPEVLLAVEAIWQVFSDDDDCLPEDSGPGCSEDHVFMAISKAALPGSTPSRAIQFQGSV
ncbi:uncharacterized protein [Miscanthus floridulus]|uniref:uncharacterized protein n=1 Tax=Miscanthus floridulus TaxID=154761 RepID=UPI00345A067D